MSDLPGDLVRSRVTDALDTVLGNVLDRAFTGHLAIEPGDTLLLDADGRAILTVEDGIPRTAYHTGIDTGGPPVLEALTHAGPYRVEYYATTNPRRLGTEIDPVAPAERLTTNDTLLRRTRAAAPDTPDDRSLDAVETFLEDDETIEAIRERARDQAERRAAEWNLDT